MTLADQLSPILAEIGPNNIWRPVHDTKGNLLIPGIGYDQDGIAPGCGLRFDKKSVADLGCNLGHFSRMAATLGASLVHGYDENELMCRGARLLADMHGYPEIEFYPCDILKPKPQHQYDMALLVDFIGKKIVSKGLLPNFLTSLTWFTAREIVLTVRPSYRIIKDLNSSEKKLEEIYGPGYTSKGHFHVLRFVLDFLSPDWTASPLRHSLGNASKIPVRFVVDNNQHHRG